MSVMFVFNLILAGTNIVLAALSDNKKFLKFEAIVAWLLFLLVYIIMTVGS